MIGIVIATHGNLASAFIETSEMLIGKQEGVKAVCLTPNEAGSEFNKKIEEEIQNLKDDNYDEIVVLLDLIGGTPFNQTIKVLEKEKLQLLVGANLPMVIASLLFDRSKGNIETLVKEATNSAKEGIVDINSMLN